MTALRGTASSAMRNAVCKDCAREIEGLRRAIDDARSAGDDARTASLEGRLAEREASTTFSYTEHSASNVINRGGSRSDRCPEHRRKHRTNIQGMAVAYVDLETIGEAIGAREEHGPSGPLGGLGPMPGSHQQDERTADLAEYEFGMNDRDIVEILELLRHKRVLVLKAGTGTGKSTFGPYRLMDPPTVEDLERLGLLDELREKGIEDRDGNGEIRGIYKLPTSGPLRLTDLGQIIVTEPRVAAATGVSRFVGEKLAMGCGLKQCSEHGTFNPKAHPDGPDGIRGPSCPDLDHLDEAQRCKRDHVGSHPWPRLKKKCVVSDCYSHVGPGYPVGYQVSGDRNHDENCQLVFVTDGTMINWLREGRLSRIGTVIVDEAHERSTNIDFIMGFLRRDLEKYPHLRVIITSATFEPKFYEAFFGGSDVVAVKEVPAVKTVGYGMPLFPDLDTRTPEISAFVAESTEEVPKRWPEQAAWPLVDETEADTERFIKAHWPITDKEGRALLDADGRPLTFANAPKLKENEVQDPRDIGYEEDLWKTTRALMPLRFGQVEEEKILPPEVWKQEMPTVLADFIVRLTKGLDDAGIFGDILGFLPTARTIEEACERIRAEVGDDADVCGLVSSLPDEEIDKALSARRKGDRRKIVVSTNLAETSLTVEGVRFVVDTGLIAQSEWDAKLASGGVSTKLHSKAGIKQRWGRVGRKAPGWVFPLYTKAQYAALAEDTPPGSARENLENLMMTARMGGIDDVKTFPWPAAFPPDGDQFAHIELDDSATRAREQFIAELGRADAALKSNGAVDADGHPTTFGKELNRFSGLGSAASAMAIMYADRLGCVPEVATILALLENTRLLGRDGLFQDSYDWPDEWRVEAAARHRGLAALAEDDAHLVLLVSAAWERADDQTPPWESSTRRRAWARQWWISNDVLLAAAKKRQEALAGLSPAMKEEVKRFVEPALLDRARGVLARTLKTFEFVPSGDDAYVRADAGLTAESAGEDRYTPERDTLVRVARQDDAGLPVRVIALRRREARTDLAISNLIKIPAAAELTSTDTNPAASVADAMALVLAFREHARPDPTRDVALGLLGRWPVGTRVRLGDMSDGVASASQIEDEIEPFARPRTEAEALEDGIATRRGRSRRKFKRRRTEDEDAPSATREDAAGELGLRQRSGENDEAAEARAFAATDAALGVDAGCGECEACRAGRRCTNPPEDDGGRQVFDAIRGAKITLNKTVQAAVDAARLKMPDGDGVGPWFEVTGYEYDDGGELAVILHRDWRGEGTDPDPARHHEVGPGDPIQVIVGAWVEDHSDRLRVFTRQDGLGRFLLREAPASFKTQRERNQIAVSLSSGAQGLLELLQPGQAFTATVVPARAEGCFTITLLETLYQHLRQAQDSLPQVPADPDNPKKGMVGAYPARVAQEPNEHGWMLFRLTFQDSKRGLHHLISHKPGGSAPSDDHDDPDTVPANEEADGFKLRCPWNLRLTLARSSLPVGGMDLDQIETIRDASNRELWVGVPRRDREASRDGEVDGADVELVATSSDDDDGPTFRPAPRKMKVEPKQGHPLSRVLAAKLAELDDSPEWQNDVWTFWARSHHVVIERTNGVLPGTDVDDVDVAFEQGDTETRTPAEIAQGRYAEYKAGHKVGDRIDAEVERVSATHVNVLHSNGAEGVVHVSNLRWGERIADASDLYAPGDHITAEILSFDEARAKIELSVKALLPEPYLEYKGRHKIDDSVEATVERVSKTHVNVLHSNGAHGVVHVSNLRWVRVEDATELYKPGEKIRAKILKFDEEKRQIELSVKALQPEPFKAFMDKHPVGTTVGGVVTKMHPKSAAVGLAEGVRGSIFIRHVTGYALATFDGHLRLNERYDFRILDYDLERRQVNLARFGLTSPPPPKPRVTPPAPAATRPPGVASSHPSRPAPRAPRTTTGEGPTVDAAVRTACRALGTTTAQVRVEVLDEGARGLFRKRPAKVRVTERL